MGWRAFSVVVLVGLWPGLVSGQEKAGVVTTLEGQVTAVRVAVPQPIHLKFKDDVYRNDRITTGDRALARMLLGGKAMVTVRERSVITITEAPGKATIELVAGKIGLAVAKERMRPGDAIEVRTANAVCAVRGTVIVADVQNATAQAGAGAPGIVTSFYVLTGKVEAIQFVPGTNTPVGAPMLVNTLQSFTATGNAPPHLNSISPEQIAQITEGLKPSGMQQGQGTTDQVVGDQVSMAGSWLGAAAVDQACCSTPRPFTPSAGDSGATGATTSILSDGGGLLGGGGPGGAGGAGGTGGIGGIGVGGKLHGLDQADHVAGPNGLQGRQNAREKQGAK